LTNRPQLALTIQGLEGHWIDSKIGRCKFGRETDMG
jgi:hypothetical protein